MHEELDGFVEERFKPRAGALSCVIPWGTVVYPKEAGLLYTLFE